MLKINSYHVEHAHEHYEKADPKSLLPLTCRALASSLRLLQNKPFVPFDSIDVIRKRRSSRDLQHRHRLFKRTNTGDPSRFTDEVACRFNFWPHRASREGQRFHR